MGIRLFAMAFALSVAGASPSQAFADEKKAQQNAGEDLNEKICENITMVGSRLAQRRVCATRAEWADRKLQDRQAVEKAQTSPCVLKSNSGGKPSC